jgi:GWxTD domain-containing protein
MRTRLSVLILLAAALLRPGTAAAQKLDKDEKKWLDEVRPLMLSDEENQYKKLKDKADRLEFQKIFWARRDPDLATPQNEAQEQFAKDVAEAERLYRIPGQAGSTTDCGRVFILLGKPDEVQAQTSAMTGVRAPEVWIYKDRPGRTFQGGKAAISFDPDCRGTTSLASQLDRLAAAKILHLNIDYRTGKDGHLVKLADLLPKDTQARALFKAPRQDFAITAQAWYLKVADGSTALVGLVRGEAAGLAASESGGVKTVNVSVAASATAEGAPEAGWSEQTMAAPVGPDGSFVGSFKLGLKPGKYTLRAGAVDVKGGKGALASLPVEVPDLNRQEAGADGASHSVPSAASLILLRDIDELVANVAPDPAHPYAAFSLGVARLKPFFGTIFKKSDQLQIFFQVYDLSLDASGKADSLATVSILKDGRTPKAKADNPLTTAVGGSVIGPVLLADYEPGKYVVRLRVQDRLAKKDVGQETAIEIVP